MGFDCEINIDKTFILEPILVSGGSATFSACSGVYTSKIVSCDNGNKIDLSVSGETSVNGRFRAELIDDINTVRGGAFVIKDLDVIFNNPGLWYPRLIEGQIVVTTSGGTNSTPQIFRLKDINQFDNQSGWDKVVEEETHKIITVTTSATSVTFIAIPKPFDDNKIKVFLNGVLQDETLDYEIVNILTNLNIDFTNAPYNLDNNDRIRIIYN